MTDTEDSSGNDQQGAKPAATGLRSDAATQESVPEWLGSRLRQMFTDVMHEPVPDEFASLLKQLEDKERG